MRQIFLATTALSLCLSLAACNDDKGGGSDNSSTFNELNQKIDNQTKEIAALKSADAETKAAFETRLTVLQRALVDKPEVSPALEERLTALQELIGKIPAFKTNEEFADFKTKVENLRADLDIAPKTAKLTELSDSLTALADKSASATDFKQVKDYVDGVKTKLDALLAAADPEELKTLKDTLAALRKDLTGKTTFTDMDIKGFTGRISTLEKLIDSKADVATVPALAAGKFACNTEEKSNILTSTPASMLDKNKAPAVVPRIAKWQGGTDNLTLTAKSRINIEPANAKALQTLADGLVTDLTEITGLTLPVVSEQLVRDGDIALSLSPCNEAVKTQIGNEGYSLSFGKAAILRGNISKGVRVDEDKKDYTDSVFYATRTLLQMLMLDGKEAKAHVSVPQGYAVDIPRFSQRRIMFDVGRKFADKAFLKSFIKFMGWYRLNTLHLHLSDQAIEGTGRAFRLQTDNLDFASLMQPGEKAYSKSDWAELEEAAAANGVSIVPEFDTPGHAEVFALAKPEIATKGLFDPAKPEALTYVKSVFTEFLPWFKSNRIHMGGDEVFGVKPELVVPYLNALGSFLIDSGKTVEMWSDGAYVPFGLDKRLVITDWSGTGVENTNWAMLGHTWLSASGNWYIVPKATWIGWNPNGFTGDRVYDHWNGNVPPSPSDAPIGGQISVWNDNGFVKPVKYTWEKEVHDILKDAIPAAGQLWWGNQIKDADGKTVPYSEIRKSVGILQYGPGVALFAGSPLDGGPKVSSTTATNTKSACVPRKGKTCPS
jgi:hexosaminidase